VRRVSARELGADGDVAPLSVRDLQLAGVGLAQVIEVEALEQHVAEFGVADP